MVSQGALGHADPRRNNTPLLCYGLIFVLSYGVYFAGGWLLFQTLALGTVEAFYDSDPTRTFTNMVAGSQKPTQISPFMYPVINAFVTPLRAVLQAFGGAPDAVALAKIHAGLAFFPLLGAIRNTAMFAVFRLMSCPLPYALLATVLFALCASNLVFGSVPDSYGVSGTVLAVLLWVAARALMQDQRGLSWRWIAIGTLCFGVMVTHIVPLAIASVVTFFEQGRRLLRAFVSSLGVLVSSVVLALALSMLFYKALPAPWVIAPQQEYRDVQSHLVGLTTEENEAFWNAARETYTPTWWVREELAPGNPVRQFFERVPAGNHIQLWLLRFDPMDRFVTFPRTLLSSVSLQNVATQPTLDGQPGRGDLLVYDPATERTGASLAVQGLAAALLLIGIYRLAGLGPKHRALLAMGLGIVIYNWLFHSVWGGSQLFLYSQHWIAALFVILGGAFAGVRRNREPLAMAAALCCAVLIVANVFWWLDVSRILTAGI